MLLDATSSPQSSRKRLLGTALIVPFIIALLFLVRMPLSWKDQAIFSGLIIACCIVLGRLSDSRLVTSALTLISVFCTGRYFVWRWTSSVSFLNNSGWHVDVIGLGFALLLLCAETYSVTILLLGYFQSARPLKRRPIPLPANTELWPSVDIFIPTYNEPIEVVRPTVLAALGIDWPQDRLHVYILDDGRREEFKDFAAECGSGYLTRSNNFHAKAGNINEALKKTKGEYVAIFDCDHIPTRSFLQITMGWFGADKRLAMVQTPHHFYSPDPFERNLDVFRAIPNEGALFYGVVQDGNDLWNATFFCGSCAVISREALEQIGGIAVETVTEDAHTALRLQRRGWNTAYLGIPQAAGLATGSLAAHVGQRIRWARGMVQILRTECPLFASGLRLSQRLCYFNCVIHYLYAIPRLIFISAPLVYLLLGKSNLYGYIWEILAYAAPHLILSNMVTSRSQGDHRHSFWNEIYEMVLAPYILLPTTFALINPRWGKFNVTAKTSLVEDSFFDWKIARPYLLLLALNLVAIVTAVPRYFTPGGSHDVLLVNVAWSVLNSLMLGACIAACYEARQRRSSVRVQAALSATLVLGRDDIHHCQVIDLSEGGVALRSEHVLNCEPGQPAEVTVRAGEEEFRFPLQAIRTSENRIHLRFLHNDLKHQRAITKLVYARADSWLDWTKDQRRDRIMGSLVTVLGIGAKGIWMLPNLLIKRESKQPAKPARGRLAKSAGSILPLLLLLLPLLTLRAQNVAALTPGNASTRPLTLAKADDAAQTFQDVQTLADLGRKSALVLKGDTLKASFGFVLPGTKLIDSAELAIRFQESGFAAAESAELAVTLNQVEITSVPLQNSAAVPDPIHISLPADLLVHDNTLSFELRRHCADPCKQASEQTWIRVEPATQLITSGSVLRLPNRLSMLPAPFFDPSVYHSIDVPFVFESEPDLASLKASGVLASWYGSLAGYRGSHFTTFVGQFPKGNVILISRPNGPLTTALGLSGAEAQVAICDNPSDRYGKVLAVVGNSNLLEQLSRAVISRRFTEETDRIVFDAGSLIPPPAVSARPSWYETKQPLRIARDQSGESLHAKVGSPARFYFRIAPDLDYGSKITVPLHLAFRLSGLVGEDHAWISIRLNNTFITKQRVSVLETRSAQLQSFAVPVSLLYPSNTLTIEPATSPSDANVSDPAALDLQILPSTDLDLQNPAHLMRMPRLDLFAASGYPFTSKADGSEMTVIVPEYPSPAQIGLFLDAMSFMSAQTAVPASEFNVVHSADAGGQRERNLLIIASSNDENTFRRFEASMIVIPMAGKFVLGESPLPWLEWFSRAWIGRTENLQAIANLLEDQAAPPNFLMQEFVSPLDSKHSVLLLATRSEGDDQPYFVRLAEASREGFISGGVALADGVRFTSFQVSSQSYVPGRQLSVAAVYDWLQFHLWVIPLLLLGGALLVACGWEQYLADLAERRLRVGA